MMRSTRDTARPTTSARTHRILRPSRLLLLAGAWLALIAPLSAQTSYPMLMGVHPVAAQLGQASEHEFNARFNLYGANQVIITGAGVTGEVVPEAKPAVIGADGKKPMVSKIKVKFTVAPDTLPGVRDVRVITAQGASTLGQIVIVRDPVVVEQDKNDTAAEAQVITVPATVCGTIEKAEDVDFFKFQVAAGAALSFHVQSNRLENRIHDLQAHSDPILTLRNSAGVTLAASDNYFFADPFLRYKFEQAGEYLLEIRDVRYQGNVDWRYSIEISDRPFVTNLFPLGLTPGAESAVELIGFKLPELPMSKVALPATSVEGPMTVGVPMGGDVTNPVPVFASPLPAVLEAAGDNNAFATAQPITVPAGISGRLEADSDIDCYAFDAKKGDAFAIEVIARRLQSPLDSHLRIINDKGAGLNENDDARFGRLTYSDSWIENFTAAADGRYAIEIRDLHLRGGAEFVYFVKIIPAKPYFSLLLDTDKTILAPGLNAPIFVRVERKNGFVGPIDLAIEGLPPGVTASLGRILESGQDGCIMLQAAADAPRGATNIKIRGTATIAQPEGQPPLVLTAAADPLQEIYFPGGGRGHYPADIHTVSVGEPLDLLEVHIAQRDITLKPGESQKIEVSFKRAPGFDQNVTLDLIYRHLGSVFGDSLPKGVTIDEKNSQTLLSAKQTSGWITIQAAKDAPVVEKQQVAVMALVSINFVMKMTYAAEPLTITVTAP